MGMTVGGKSNRPTYGVHVEQLKGRGPWEMAVAVVMSPLWHKTKGCP